MARLANKFVQVLVTYATLLRTWGEIWVPLGCIAFTLAVHRGKPPIFSLFAGFFAGTMFAGLVRQQSMAQFAHPRSALLPGFAGPHLLAAGLFAAFATLLPSAVFAAMGYADFLFMAAVASLTFAFASAWFRSIHNEIVREMFPVITGVPILCVCLFGLLMDGAKTRAVPPAVSLALLGAGWAFIGYNFVRLVRLRDDEATFQASPRLAPGSPQQVAYLRGLIGNTRFTRKRSLSDVWNDRIRGFHGQTRLRIIWLLRHGAGPWPFEPAATLAILFCTGCAALFIYASSQDDFPVLWRLFPVLIALVFPSSAAAELWLRRQNLGSELLRPLSREQLIDGIFAGSLLSFAVFWIPTNLLAICVLWSFPGVEPSLSRIATFVFMSAGLSVAALGFSLYVPLRMPLGLRMLVNLFFIVAWFTVLPWWWFWRDRIGDAPFWIISTLALTLGMWAIRQARRQWLNAELGIRGAC